MKKIIFLAAVAAAMILGSCTRTEIVENKAQGDAAVEFGTYTTQATRGNGQVVTTDNLNAEDFGVWGFYTSQETWGEYLADTFTPAAPYENKYPRYMWNQYVDWEAGAATYTPVKYWPNTLNDKVSFFAYSPFQEQTDAVLEKGIVLSKTNDAGWPFMDFTIDSLPQRMEDLLYADNLCDQVKQTTKIKFVFEHALTRVNLQARLDKDLVAMYANGKGDTYVVITSIDILGTGVNDRYPEQVAANAGSRFIKTARFQYGLNNADDEANKAAFTDSHWDYDAMIGEDPVLVMQEAAYPLGWQSTDKPGMLAMVHPEFTSQATLTDWAVDEPQFYGTAATLDATRFATLWGAYWGVVIEDTATSLNPVSLFDPSQYLFLIPPHGWTGIENENELKLQVGYDIITFDSKINDGFSITHTDEIVSLPNETLKQAVAYNFILTIGLEDVKIDAEVTDWGEEQNYYAPSSKVEVTTTNALTADLTAAFVKLNAAKAVNPDCNYFVLNVVNPVSEHFTMYNTANEAIFEGEGSYFVPGDIIEVNYKGGVINTAAGYNNINFNVKSTVNPDAPLVYWEQYVGESLNYQTPWSDTNITFTNTTDPIRFFLRKATK